MTEIGAPQLTLPYGPDAEQLLDVHVPSGWQPDDRRPVVVHVHGGGWKGGSRSDVSPLVAAQVRRGWVVVSVDYRLTPGAAFPEPIRDVDRAVRFVRANAGRLGVDPARLVLTGHSAGGYLAAAVGLGDMRPLLVSPDLPAELRAQSSRPQAIVTMGAILDIESFSDDPWWAAAWITNLFLACPAADELVLACSPSRMKAASVTEWLDSRDPPMFVVHGIDDRIVGVEQAWLVDKRSQEVGHGRVLLDIVDSGPLDARQHYPDYGANLTELESFLDDSTR